MRSARPEAPAPPVRSAHGPPRPRRPGRAVGGPGGGGGRPPRRVGDQDAHRARPAGHGHRVRRAGRAAGDRRRHVGGPDRAARRRGRRRRRRRGAAGRHAAAPTGHPGRPRSTTTGPADAAATLLTAELADPTGYGRVVRGRDDSVARVVEHGDATDEELEVREINTSIYCFRRSVLAPSLRRLSPANAQGEYYLTDVVGVLYEAGHKVGSVVVEDTMEVAGVNDRAQLAVAEAELRDRINERWMRRGVTMWDPERTYIDVDVGARAGRGAAARGHPPGVVRDRRPRRDRARRAPGRHGGGGGGDGGLQRVPPVGDRGRRPDRPVRRAGGGDRGRRRAAVGR